MVAQPTSSEKSTRNAGKRTKETSVYSQNEELEIVNQSLRRYQTAGGKTEIMPEFYHGGRRAVVVIIYETQFVSGAIVPLVVPPESSNAAPTE